MHVYLRAKLHLDLILHKNIEENYPKNLKIENLNKK